MDLVRTFRLSKFGKGGQQTPEGSEVRWAYPPVPENLKISLKKVGWCQKWLDL